MVIGLAEKVLDIEMNRITYSRNLFDLIAHLEKILCGASGGTLHSFFIQKTVHFRLMCCGSDPSHTTKYDQPTQTKIFQYS